MKIQQSFGLFLISSLMAGSIFGCSKGNKTESGPAYVIADNWGALPSRKDGADKTPLGVEYRDRQGRAKVDAFVVLNPPFSSLESDLAGLDMENPAGRLDQLISHQASVFNGIARVFVPRYRAANPAIAIKPQDGPEAMSTAYQDVYAAFETWLNKDAVDRPFFLAGHGQGASHLLRLLLETWEKGAYKDRLIGVYLWGIPVPKELVLQKLPGLPFCGDETQASCLSSWTTFLEDSEAAFFTQEFGVWQGEAYLPVAGTPLLCTNPLNWQTDGAYAGQDQNLGGLPFSAIGHRLQAPIPGAADARCDNGRLLVTSLGAEGFEEEKLAGGELSNLDINLYYTNIRKNLESRLASWQTVHSK